MSSTSSLSACRRVEQRVESKTRRSAASAPAPLLPLEAPAPSRAHVQPASSQTISSSSSRTHVIEAHPRPAHQLVASDVLLVTTRLLLVLLVLVCKFLKQYCSIVHVQYECNVYLLENSLLCYRVDQSISNEYRETRIAFPANSVTRVPSTECSTNLHLRNKSTRKRWLRR